MALTPSSAASWRMVTASGPCSANSRSPTSQTRSRKSAISWSERVLGIDLANLWRGDLHAVAVYGINLQRKHDWALKHGRIAADQPVPFRQLCAGAQRGRLRTERDRRTAGGAERGALPHRTQSAVQP